MSHITRKTADYRSPDSYSIEEIENYLNRRKGELVFNALKDLIIPRNPRDGGYLYHWDLAAIMRRELKRVSMR